MPAPPAVPPAVPAPPPISGAIPPPPALAYLVCPGPPEPPKVAGTRVAAALCLILGLGLIGGAVAGAAVSRGPRAERPVVDASVEAFAMARQVWRDTPVDGLFPRSLTEADGGPGGADRAWTRVGVAAPAGCAGAFDPLLQQVLAPVGCVRLLRATYVDSTSTTVTTVGLLVAAGETPAMRALSRRWTAEHLGDRADLVPRTVAFPATPAGSFGDHQRGSWDVQISADLPFIVYAVSGFADGRVLPAPQPARTATAPRAASPAAQAGLGFDATGVASAVDDRLHAAVSAALHPATRGRGQR